MENKVATVKIENGEYEIKITENGNVELIIDFTLKGAADENWHNNFRLGVL